MPERCKRPCSGGCGRLTKTGKCAACAKNKHISRPYDQRRGNSTERGYDGAWRKLRLVALKRDLYLCQECLKQNRPTPATEVDHKIPINVDPDLRLDLDNLQSLCSECHKRKTILEDGAFGRPLLRR